MFSLSTTAGNALLTALVAAADAGSGAAKIRIYDGVAPQDANAVLAANNQLAELTCASPCGSVSAKTLTFDTVTDDTSIDATGTASFFRLLDSDDNVIAQGRVTDSGGNGDLRLSTVSLIQAGTVSISSATVSI